MTVYNRDRYLEEAIESVLNQTRQEFEFIIWDDGSSDRSLEIAQCYATHDPRIRVFKSKHQGRSLSLSAAHHLAQGNYLAWVDSDDRLAPTALEETSTILDKNPHIGWVYTNYQVIDERGKILGLGKRCQIPYSKDRLLVDFMTFHFRLFRRTCFEKAGGIYTELSQAPDYDLCLRLSEVAQVFHLEKTLYDYRRHQESISTEHRIEQILCSQEIINRALIRRGLSERYELNVEIVGKFSLRAKSLLEDSL